MILKDYQKRALETIQEFLEQLIELRGKAKRAKDEHDINHDWVKSAWENLDCPHAYHLRKNGLGEFLPSFCLKIPTGGGKTLLAIKVVDLVNTHYFQKQTGLVLWIVPTAQIYSQTLKSLRDRDHPYRQQLDIASAGRTVVLEKTNKFSPQGVEENLCILLLMLPSANREITRQLKIFQDNCNFDKFFPSDDDTIGHKNLLERIPNLDTFEHNGGLWGHLVMTSLGNTLRLLQPLIILDEGHRAYSANARKTLEGFNPGMIVELSATPAQGANVLVNISGRELLAEEMIKLDLHIKSTGKPSWKETLLAAIDHRKLLEDKARQHEAETGVYIRPICLIQVERTGENQQAPNVVHADDVREYLLQHPEIGSEQIALKTHRQDELKDVDENGGLLSSECPVRFIITKHALQEGWDCSFAYILAILANPASKTGLTQLVGRVLRQPYARKTRVALLDESYVFCFQRRGNDLLGEIRKGFGMEGLQDLRNKVVNDDSDGQEKFGKSMTLKQRKQYRKAVGALVLPAFMIKDGREWRLVRYEADILSRVPWDKVDISSLFDLTLDDGREYNTGGRVGPDGELVITPSDIASERRSGRGGIDYLFAAAHFLDVMPNPWLGNALARRVFDELLKKYSCEQVTANYTFVITEIHRHLEAERDRLSRGVFEELLDSEAMRFLVVAKGLDFNRLPKEIEIIKGKKANREDGDQYRYNLFEWMNEDELNGLENKVATYLDRQERLFFWYRNRSRKDYYVQGWKPGRIYADFVITLKPDEPGVSDAYHRVFVVETKGLHLKRAMDTDYKRSVFDICSQHAKKQDWAKFVPVMKDKVVRFEVVDEDEWQSRLNAMLSS